MPSTIQIRNVPADLHPQLKARAAFADKCLSDYLLSFRELAEQPTNEELIDRLRRRPIDLRVDPVDIIRDHRDRE